MNLLDVIGAGPYNLTYVGGLGAGMALAAWQAHRRGWSLLPWLALLAACIAGGVLGSKTLHFDLEVGHPREKTILGGLAGGMITMLLVQRWLRPPAGAGAVLAPSVLIGFAVGRVGCFLAGCCFGRPTAMPWAVRYAPGTHPYEAQLATGLLEPGAAASLPVHATQLYEAALALLLALVLWRGAGRLRSAGAPALVVAAGYGVIRFVVDFLRADGTEHLLLGLKTVQWTVAVLVVAAAAVLAWRELRTRACVPGRMPLVRQPAVLRSASVLAVILVLSMLGAGWLTPLERSALILASLPAALVLLRTSVLALPWRVMPGVAAGVLVVAPLPQDTLRRHAERYFTIGASGTTGHFETWRNLTPDEECGTGEGRRHDFDVYGVSGAYTRRQSATSRYVVRLQTFFGTNRIRIDDGASTDRAPIRGAALSGTTDTRLVGFTGGIVSGSTIDGDGLPTSSTRPVLGVRVGLLDGVHGELRVNDHEPGPYPDTPVIVSLGYGFRGWGESVIRVGAWERGLFLGGRLVTGSGTELEPFVGLGGGGGNQFGLAVRQRVGTVGRPPGR